MSKWIEVTTGLGKRYKCPFCGYEVPRWTSVYYNYCHCCGTDMGLHDAPWWDKESDIIDDQLN